MRLKYYMRGIGIAMIVTALLLGYSYRNDSKGMTDEEIIARAKELGMIENNFLNLSPSPGISENQTENEPEPSKEPEETQQPEETSEPEISREPDEPVVSDDASGLPEVTILEIRRGDSSNSVSQRLADAGLVEDAKAYDKYLCANGYDKRISVGTFEIPAGSSEEEIARIITKQK